MSGITGIYNLDQSPVAAEDLYSMLDVMAHRGPDGADIWVEGSVGLGHRMLWTTPESVAETLPAVKGNLAITGDIRLDNRAELISLLRLDDCMPHNISDSEIVLSAYDRWQAECLDKLLGAFSFTIWDKRRQILFCARDHFGVKPFYYHASKQLFIFATEVKAILCDARVPQDLNEDRIGDYLTSNFEDTKVTFYKAVSRLPPAHYLVVSQESISLKSYWTLDFSKELKLGSNEEYAAAFREQFKEATACRMRSRFLVGSMLSGGMDSSSIACMSSYLRKAEDQPFPTYSAIFDKIKQSDEQPYIQSVLEQGYFSPNYIHGDNISPLTDVERIQWHQDEPHSAFNLFINWNLYKIAGVQGVRVILDGFDGDSTISHGVAYMHDLAKSRQWIVLSKELYFHSQYFGYSPFAALWSLVKKNSPFLRIGQKVYRGIRRRLAGEVTTDTSGHYAPQLNQTFVQRTGLAERHRQLASRWKAIHKEAPCYKQNHYYSLMRGVMPHTLETLNHASAPFALEVRFPFFDKRLIEFCFSLPPEQRISKGLTRMVLRRGMEGILPSKVQWRSGKSNLGFNFDHTFIKYERERISRVLRDQRDLIATYSNVKSLESAYERYVSGNASSLDITDLWKAVTLALWMQKNKAC